MVEEDSKENRGCVWSLTGNQPGNFFKDRFEMGEIKCKRGRKGLTFCLKYFGGRMEL